MNEINKTLPQLLGMLRTAESDLKKNGSKSILIVREAKRKERKGQSLRKPREGLWLKETWTYEREMEQELLH
ncbi:hypothetical protein V6N13_004519 [Hibiscus sabdariffa]